MYCNYVTTSKPSSPRSSAHSRMDMSCRSIENHCSTKFIYSHKHASWWKFRNSFIATLIAVHRGVSQIEKANIHMRRRKKKFLKHCKKNCFFLMLRGSQTFNLPYIMCLQNNMNWKFSKPIFIYSLFVIAEHCDRIFHSWCHPSFPPQNYYRPIFIDSSWWFIHSKRIK